MLAGGAAGAAKGISTIGGMQFAHVKGGTFRMGHPDYTEAGCRKTRVRGFRMGVDPVTNAQMNEFIADMQGESDARGAILQMANRFRSSPAANRLHIDEGYHFHRMLLLTRAHELVPGLHRYEQRLTGLSSEVFALPDRPAVMVSLPQMAAYAFWFSIQNGSFVRLPTEAEWERAARGISGEDDFATPNGQARDGSGELQIHVLSNKGNAPSAVVEQPKNSFGIRGLSGNVGERVLDPYEESYDRAMADNPLGAAIGRYYMVRGGSWHNSEGDAHSASRDSDAGWGDDVYTGFRLVAPVEP